jgi:hypothetical protein
MIGSCQIRAAIKPTADAHPQNPQVLQLCIGPSLAAHDRRWLLIYKRDA